MIDIHNCKHLKQLNTDFTITSNEKSVCLLKRYAKVKIGAIFMYLNIIQVDKVLGGNHCQQTHGDVRSKKG